MTLPANTLTYQINSPIHELISPDELAWSLEVLDVPFIAGASPSPGFQTPPPAVVMSSLASSDEARLRLALIPLLLLHPEYSLHAVSALQSMSPVAHICFKCYYTAASLLQQKYRSRLDALVGHVDTLIDLFSTELGMTPGSDPDDGLRSLADRQRTLTGQYINWLGTYEHSVQRLLGTLESRMQWRT